MRRLVSGMNPTLRGFLVLALIALVVVVLQLEATLVALSLIVADLGMLLVRGVAGLDAFAFFVVLGLAGFSMWRVWRDEHTLSA